MTSSRSRQRPAKAKTSAEAAANRASAVPRPRDLLKPTAFPVHPFDQIHGVDTSGLVPARHLLTGHPNDDHVTAYYGVAPSILRSLIDQWRASVPPEPISSYTFVDIGAGKGRALLVASEYRFRSVVGVELNPQLADTARKNAETFLRARESDPTAAVGSSIEVIEQDALDFRLPDGPSLVFLFHPFEEPVFSRFIDHVDAQLSERQRDSHPLAFDLLYVNAECSRALDQHPAFSRVFLGQVKMSAEDHAADLEAIAQQEEYGSTGDEECAIYRYTGSNLRPLLRPAA